MSIDGQETIPLRKSRRKPATPSKPSRVKTTVILSAEAHQRLAIHAAMSQEDRSEIVERLILAQLRRYQVREMLRCETGPDGETAATAA